MYTYRCISARPNHLIGSGPTQSGNIRPDPIREHTSDVCSLTGDVCSLTGK